MELSENLKELKQEFGVVFGKSPRKVSQLGGLDLFAQFLRKGLFRDRLTALFGPYKTRSMLQLMMGVIAGAKDMEDVERLKADPVVSRFIGNTVVATQLTRDFKAFSAVEIQSLHDFNLKLSLYSLLESVPLGTRLTIDIDATPVLKYGSQEGVERGYVEKNKIEPCYQYILFRAHELNSILYGTIRAGSAHSQNGIEEYLSRLLPLIGHRWDVVLRMDAGFFNEKIFDICAKHDATAFIKAPMSKARSSFAFHSKELIWRKNPDDVNDAWEYASYVTKTQAGTTWREVFKRIEVRLDEKEDLGISGVVGYRYQCVATNDFVLEDWKTYPEYNGRAGIENTIKETKYDYRLGDITTDSFDANDVITQVTILAFNLMAHLKMHTLPMGMRKMWLSTLRTRLLNVPGLILSHSGKVCLRIYNAFVSGEVYAAIYARLKSLRSLILSPPDSDPLKLE